jgi:thiosulfate dehydrogenase
MIIRPIFVVFALVALGSSGACSGPPTGKASAGTPSGARYRLAGPLVPAALTIVTAWDFPRNPLTDPALDDSRLSNEIRSGFRIFTNTPAQAPRLTGGSVSCNNCHLNGGQRERALPLVGVAGQFPEYNKRAGRLITLADRVVDCFLRSENATGASGPATPSAVSPTSPEVLAVSAYLAWLSQGSVMGVNPVWRGQNAIPAQALIPLDKIDRTRGDAIYAERCASCHGTEGQGVAIGDKKAGALWGPASWNDGAGAARVYTLAGIIRYSMPYLDPGSLTDEEAQQVAAFINSRQRPAFPFKDDDYRAEKLPVDAVYYGRRSQ